MTNFRISISLASVLALTSILSGCKPNSALVISLDSISIACAAAVPFAGQYAGFVVLVEQASTAAAEELTSNDPANFQYQKILNRLAALVNQYPDVANAPADTKAKILAIESAVSLTIQLIEQQFNLTPGSARGMVAGGKPLPISGADAGKITAMLMRNAETRAKLGAK